MLALGGPFLFSIGSPALSNHLIMVMTKIVLRLCTVVVLIVDNGMITLVALICHLPAKSVSFLISTF